MVQKQNDGKYGIEWLFPNGSRLTHLMNRAHHGASGGEKEGIYSVSLPDCNGKLWISTPFGWERQTVSAGQIDALRRDIEKLIQKYLTSPSYPFPLTAFSNDLEPLLKQAIADTQRPLNDITVWDIGHSGMAFLITHAQGSILNGESIDHETLAAKGNENRLFWQVVDVRMQGLRYLKEATSIADLRARQRLMKCAIERVNEQIEQALFVGVKVYQDENGGFYLVSNFKENDPNWEKIKGIIRPSLEIDGFDLSFDLAPRPLVSHPKDNGTGEYVGSFISRQINNPPAHSHAPEAIDTAWKSDHVPREICISCNIRPQGYGAEQVKAYKRNSNYYRQKAEKRHLCCICMNRRLRVSEAWAKSGLNRDTIWTHEASDEYGRIALITGQFSL